MEEVECQYTMGPTLGAKFVPWVLPPPLWEMAHILYLYTLLLYLI